MLVSSRAGPKRLGPPAGLLNFLIAYKSNLSLSLIYILLIESYFCYALMKKPNFLFFAMKNGVSNRTGIILGFQTDQCIPRFMAHVDM